MSKSGYLENEVVKWASGQAGIFGSGVSGPYVALFNVAPTSTGGVEVTTGEVAGGSYARENSDGKWSAPTAGSVTNTFEIAFRKATASWGDIVAIGLFDASASGSLLYWGTVPTMTVGANQTARFLAGAITLSED